MAKDSGRTSHCMSSWRALRECCLDSPKPPPPSCRSNTKIPKLTETTPTAALTRGHIGKGQGTTRFQKLRKQSLLTRVLLLQREGPHASQQGTLHMHVLVCTLSNVGQLT